MEIGYFTTKLLALKIFQEKFLRLNLRIIMHIKQPANVLADDQGANSNRNHRLFYYVPTFTEY